MQRSETLLPFVDLNVLPEELRPRRHPILYILGIVALLAASLALIPLYQAERAAGDETGQLQGELDLISYDLTLAQIDLGKVKGLQRQLEAVQTDLAVLDEERQAVLGDGTGLSKDLTKAVNSLPAGASLTSVTGDANQMSLSGQAATSKDVFEYARALQTGGKLSECRVVSLERTTDEQEGSVPTFTIEAVR